MTRPNIVWIYCDELRTDALGCYGHPEIEPQTPHIDALAENGVLFEQCFCNSPVCVSSRVATLTGRYAEQTGVYHNEGAWDGYAMPTEVVTFPQVLAEHGYATANFGKWHVPPEMNRWDVCDRAGASMGDLLEIVGRDHPSLIIPDGVPTYLGGAFPADVAYPHTVLTDNALAWMAKADRPFLARLSFLEPHTPVFPPPPFDTLYDPNQFRDHQTSAEGRSAFEAQHAAVLHAETFSPRQVQLAQAYYYGLVAWVDSQVGRVLDYLEGAGLMEETILVFGADHGASMGEGGCWAKQIFAPQVHRVPRLIQWAGTLPGGQRRRDICEGLDLARTLFGLCGIEAPESFGGRDLANSASSQDPARESFGVRDLANSASSQDPARESFDGRDLANSASSQDPARGAVYATIGFGHRRSRTFPNLGVGTLSETTGWPRRACIRTADFRLDKNVRVNGRAPKLGEEDVFLADVREDPLEMMNLADDPAYETVQDRLNALLDAHVEHAVESTMDHVYERRGR